MTKRLDEKIVAYNPAVVNKPWGFELIINKTDDYVVKEIHVKAGQRLSEQFHKIKAETMFLVKGSAVLQLGNKWKNLRQLVPVYIPPLTIHRLEAIDDCIVLEVSSIELTDVVRTDDDYGRG